VAKYTASELRRFSRRNLHPFVKQSEENLWQLGRSKSLDLAGRFRLK